MTDGLHGQSIKTRVEARPSDSGAGIGGVYTDNPLKQGLKHDPGVALVKVDMSTRTIH